MQKNVKTQQGLDQFVADKWDKKLSGSIGYLCHSASIGSDYTHGIALLKKLFGSRLKKVFSPQHGLFADVQDNMKESEHFFHPHFQLPVYSLYSETRSPTPEMLEGIDYLVIDLQDVGTRVYTYIYTIALAMQACAEKNIEVVILDRPNPIGGEKIEGNILEPEFASFVGMFPIPMRHGLTIGEFAQLVKKYFDIDCRLTVIHLKNWKRSYYFDETGLPWVLPSPNLPSLETAIIYPGSVLFEATTISEGRGTVKSLETIGHPHIKPFEWVQRLLQKFEEYELKGFALRPLYFKPTFNKFAGEACGGFQVHVTDRSEFKPWSVGQVLMKELMGLLPNHFRWTNPPYEYEFKKLPIDIINGTNKLREWVEHNGTYLELLQMELEGRNEYLNKIDSILLYK